MQALRPKVIGQIGAVFSLCMVCLGVTIYPAPVAHAEDMVRLNDVERAAFQAIGRVNLPGYRRVNSCSGTLIAPDLVLTAAHCVGLLRGTNPRLHFVAGRHGSGFAAHRKSTTVAVHPMYDQTTGRDRLAFDIALIRLEEPIPSEIVAPVPIIAADQVPSGEATLLGYARTRPNTLSGAFGCPLLNVTRSSYLYGCEVVRGASGGAVLVETEDGPALAAVISARVGERGYGLAVPIKTWVRNGLYDALSPLEDRP